MEKLRFTQAINAPAAQVHKIMIGKETYPQWTAVFNPSSVTEGGGVEGNWAVGSKILFIGLSKEGKREGMVGYVRANTPGEYVSIEYAGIVDGDNEITEGPVADEWKGFENYTFKNNGQATTVTVELDVNDEMRDYFRETYPKALAKLKEICETQQA